jgi:hypothetical protein
VIIESSMVLKSKNSTWIYSANLGYTLATPMKMEIVLLNGNEVRTACSTAGNTISLKPFSRSVFRFRDASGRSSGNITPTQYRKSAGFT